VANLIFEILRFMLVIFILLNIWYYIYSSINNIKGYTSTQVMWYVLCAETVWFATWNHPFPDDVSDDIKSGNVIYKLNTPYFYSFFLFAKYIGSVFLKIITFMIICIISGILFIGPLDKFDFRNLPFLALLYIFAILITSLIYVIISMSSFLIEDNKPIRRIYDKTMIMLGIVYPIEMLPAWLKPVAEFTPIFPCIYGPVKSTVSFSICVFCQTLVVQILWLAALIFLSLSMCQNGFKKANINGG
jgi:ABC-2 type transport system permease protein